MDTTNEPIAAANEQKTTLVVNFKSTVIRQRPSETESHALKTQKTC